MIICFAGIDGCGKGTQEEFLTVALRNSGKSVFLSKAYGEAEKECFSAFIEQWSQEAILFLFQALHVEQRRRAEVAMSRGEIVIADRWDESYFAYHESYGILAGDPLLRNRLNDIAFGGLLPDITFLLDVPARMAQERLRSRGMDFFDRLSMDYHQNMRQKYLEMARQRKNWLVVDGTQKTINIHRQIISCIQPLLSRA